MNHDYLRPIICGCDPDMSREAMSSYMADYPAFMESPFQCKEGFRGDTLQSCGWTFGSGNKFSTEFNPNLRSYASLFSAEEVELINEFRFGYHCKANFAVLPAELNRWRGRRGPNSRWGKGQCDYFDIFLTLIRSYYLKLELPEKAQFYILKHKRWMDWFGKGEEGWRAFVDYYRLNPYVTLSYEVKDLFADPVSYRRADCNELTGSHHGWDFCLPLCSADGKKADLAVGKERAVNYAGNSLWIWQERSKLLVKRRIYSCKTTAVVLAYEGKKNRIK